MNLPNLHEQDLPNTWVVFGMGMMLILSDPFSDNTVQNWMAKPYLVPQVTQVPMQGGHRKLVYHPSNYRRYNIYMSHKTYIIIAIVRRLC